MIQHKASHSVEQLESLLTIVILLMCHDITAQPIEHPSWPKGVNSMTKGGLSIVLLRYPMFRWREFNMDIN